MNVTVFLMKINRDILLAAELRLRNLGYSDERNAGPREEKYKKRKEKYKQ